MTVIEFHNVKKSFKFNTVLNDLNFTIEKDVLTGIIGRNGVGKSTLMKMIAGFIKETGGDVQVFGEHPFNSLKVSANSIFIDDTMSFPEKLNLTDILREAKRFYSNWDAPLAERLFEYFSFHPNAHYSQLSKGKKNTFNAIIGIAAHCPLTIFDEPTNGMDTAVRKDFYRALLKDYLAHPRTILLSSHHLEEIEDLLEDILLIHNGTAHFHGPITELQEMYVKLVGHPQHLPVHLTNKKVKEQKTTGLSSEAIVENKFSTEEKARLTEDGIKIIPVSANDAYLQLTKGTKGGIDDVFDRTATH